MNRFRQGLSAGAVAAPAFTRTRFFVMSLLLLAATVLTGTDASAATSFYIRADGGDASQCTGKADARYSGSGTNQACAWKHPFIAFPPGGTPRIAGGDTLYIKSGSYMMGLGAPGATMCHQSWSWDCFMSAVPSGPSSTQPTRILGQGSPAPELWGTERAGMVLNLQGSSNVEVSNLEITDHESCIDNHCHGGACSGEVLKCKRDSAPYGKWSSTGISARDSKNVKLTDVNVHGMANRGVYAARLTDWTMTRLTIRGNGWAGWDGDIPDDDTNYGQIMGVAGPGDRRETGQQRVRLRPGVPARGVDGHLRRAGAGGEGRPQPPRPGVRRAGAGARGGSPRGLIVSIARTPASRRRRRRLAAGRAAAGSTPARRAGRCG